MGAHIAPVTELQKPSVKGISGLAELDGASHDNIVNHGPLCGWRRHNIRNGCTSTASVRMSVPATNHHGRKTCALTLFIYYHRIRFYERMTSLGKLPRSPRIPGGFTRTSTLQLGTSIFLSSKGFAESEEDKKDKEFVVGWGESMSASTWSLCRSRPKTAFTPSTARAAPSAPSSPLSIALRVLQIHCWVDQFGDHIPIHSFVSMSLDQGTRRSCALLVTGRLYTTSSSSSNMSSNLLVSAINTESHGVFQHRVKSSGMARGSRTGPWCRGDLYEPPVMELGH